MGEPQPQWSVEVSVRATRAQLGQYIEWLEALDPAVTVDVRGPSEIGVCLVTVRAPIIKSDDVDAIFAAFERVYPGSILMDFKG